MTKHVLVRYTLASDRVAENLELVRAVFAELERDAPPGIRYATLQGDDRVSFAHLAIIDSPDGQNPLRAVAAFRAFAEGIKDRCIEPPVAIDMTLVGEYRILAK